MRYRTLAALMLLPSFLCAQAGADSYRQARLLFDADNSKNAEAAAKLFEKAIEQEPNNADYHLWFARAIGMQAINASVFRQPFLAKHAKAEFEKTVQLDPNNIGGREGLLQFHLRAPSVMGGSKAKAREQAEALMRISPMRGHLALAQFARVEKDSAALEREYRGAFGVAPDSSAALYPWMNWLVNKGRLDEAMPLLVKRVASHPDEAGAHLLLAVVQEKKGNKDAARKSYTKALELNPKLESARKALKALG
jgi:Tfp pilus assembly protein PilF